MEQKISKWLKSYALKNKIGCLVVGISGGIDSALVSTLAAMTGLPVKIVSVAIESRDDHLKRAENHAKWLAAKYKNVKFIRKDLTAVYRDFKKLFSKEHLTDLALANTKSRLRMVALYQIAGASRGIV